MINRVSTNSNHFITHFRFGQYQIDVNFAVAVRGLYLFLPFYVIIAVDFRAAMGTMGTIRRNAPWHFSTIGGIYHIGTQADQFIVFIQKTQAVAVVQGFVGGDFHT